jgi:FkbM family methyltransferase
MINRLKIIYRYCLSKYRELYYPKYLNFGPFKLKFRFSKLNKGMKEYLSLNHETYEYGERLFSEKILSKGDRVIEAGTSIGILTGVISNIIGNEGKLITIEPDINLIKIAQSNNKYNTNITFLNGMLITDSKSNIEFQPDGWLGGKVINVNNKANNVNSIPIIYLKDLISNHMPNALALDIEGEELGLIYSEIPICVKKLIIELHPHIYGENSSQQIKEYITNQKFVLQGNHENIYSYLRST